MLVIDNNGKTVGTYLPKVTPFQGVTADDEGVYITAFATHFATQITDGHFGPSPMQQLFFASTDCTGPAYLYTNSYLNFSTITLAAIGNTTAYVFGKSVTYFTPGSSKQAVPDQITQCVQTNGNQGPFVAVTAQYDLSTLNLAVPFHIE
jgi:hypothetical protein